MTALKDNTEKPRKPGRPRGSRPATANREQLMDIALRIFAQQGIGHTSLNAIAREAGVTPAMLHYYFNSREQLLDAIIEERFLPLRSKIVTHFTAHPDDPISALTLMVRALAEQAQQYEWFAPLWMQEAMGEMPVLRAHIHAQLGENKYHHMLGVVTRWQQTGKLNAALAPELLFTTLLSLVLIPFARRRNDERLNHLSPEQIVDHVLAVLGHGIGA